MKYTASGIAGAEARLRAKKEAYLKANGWTRTNATPGNLWLWRKSIFGETFAVDTLSAVRIQLSSEK